EADDASPRHGQARAGDRAEPAAAAAAVLDGDVLELERVLAHVAKGSTGQAKRRPARSTSGGTSVTHVWTAWRQRGWSAHPDGTAAGLGGAPPIATRA